MGKLLFMLIYGGLTLLIAPLSGWLLLKAQTWIGRGIALTGLIVVILPATSWL